MAPSESNAQQYASAMTGDISPRKAKRIRLSRDASVQAAACSAIAEAHAQFSENLALARRSFEPELLHQARVGLRRLRVFVRLFRSRIGRERAVALLQELRWFFALLGDARDMQVFEADFLPSLSASERSKRALRARIREATASAQSELEATLEEPRFRALCADLSALDQELEALPDHDKRARPWLAKRLDRQLASIHEHQSSPAGESPLARGTARFDSIRQEDLTALHELRKQLKKLRYTAELARALFPAHPKRTRTYLRALVDLQDALGALTDVQLSRAVLTRTFADAPLSSALETQLGRLTEERRAPLAVSLTVFLGTRPFWRRAA